MIKILVRATEYPNKTNFLFFVFASKEFLVKNMTSHTPIDRSHRVMKKMMFSTKFGFIFL